MPAAVLHVGVYWIDKTRKIHMKALLSCRNHSPGHVAVVLAAVLHDFRWNCFGFRIEQA